MRLGETVVALSLLCSCHAAAAQTKDQALWTFAVSGDSRNCGDVVMPAIAQGVQQDHAAFYWHLGDFRAIYDFDEDYKQAHGAGNIIRYEENAWQDFTEKQLMPFGDTPVFLALGNHETISPKTRSEAVQAFADWLDDPVIRAQRLADDPRNHKLETYYHWIKGPVDFITLDNGSDDMFDSQQVRWLEDVLERARKNDAIKSIVVGMHRALPDSLSSGHGMNDTAQGTQSGRRVYRDLAAFKTGAHKNVYVLASHSHFFMGNIYDTACRERHHETILPGWIVGAAGAVRYELPKELANATGPQNDLYGYLLGRVLSDGSVQFEFRPIKKQLDAIPGTVRQAFTDEFVNWCLNENHDRRQFDNQVECPADVPASKP